MPAFNRPARLSTLAATVLLAGGALVLWTRVPEPPVPGEVFDRHSDVYHEEHGEGRAVAQVEATLRRANATSSAQTGVVLELAASALGPGVQAVPGYQGVRGANRRTAEELDALLEDREQLEFEVRPLRDADAGSAVPGRIVQVQLARLPERRLLSDGRIDHDALSRRKLPVRLELVTQSLPPGSWRAALLVRGRARLAVDFTFTGRDGAIVAVHSDPPGPAQDGQAGQQSEPNEELDP